MYKTIEVFNQIDTFLEVTSRSCFISILESFLFTQSHKRATAGLEGPKNFSEMLASSGVIDLHSKSANHSLTTTQKLVYNL